jgi:hypothetical protein
VCWKLGQFAVRHYRSLEKHSGQIRSFPSSLRG